MTTQEIALAPCVVLSDPSGSFVGVAAAEVILSRIEDVLVDLMAQNSGTVQFIMEERGMHSLVAASIAGVSISSSGVQVGLAKRIIQVSPCHRDFFLSDICLQLQQRGDPKDVQGVTPTRPAG